MMGFLVAPQLLHLGDNSLKCQSLHYSKATQSSLSKEAFSFLHPGLANLFSST